MSEASGLSKRAGDLTSAITTLTESVAALTDSQARIRRIVWLTVVGLILDTLLTVVAGFLIFNQRSVSDRLDQSNQNREQIRVLRNTEVYCPLFDLLLDTVPLVIDAHVQSPEKAALLARTSTVLQHGKDVLGC